MTKAERKEKYTRLARERSAQKALRKKGERLICYHCRQRGHVAEHCPDTVGEGRKKASRTTKCCYKCGSMDHALSACPVRNEGGANDLPFAKCFVCGKQGHLASTCTANEKGIYINGGECKTCGSKLHLSKNCPDKGKKKRTEDDSDDDSQQFADLLEGHGDDHGPRKDDSKGTDAPQKTTKKRVVKF